MDGTKDLQSLSAACQVHVADEHVDLGRELRGLVACAGSADQSKVGRSLYRGSDGGQDRGMVIDDADACRGSRTA
jgi:hypothetical protein